MESQENLQHSGAKSNRRQDRSYAKDLVRQLKNSDWFDQDGNPPDTKEFSLIGLLMKRRSGFGRHIGQRWVNRCFALKNGRLVYFESDTLASVDWANPRGVLNLTDPDVSYTVNRPFENAPSSHTLQINVASNSAMRWKLCAFTVKELESWANEIGKHCQLKDIDGRTASTNIASDYDPTENQLDSPRSPQSPSGEVTGFTFSKKTSFEQTSAEKPPQLSIPETPLKLQPKKSVKAGPRKRLKKTQPPSGIFGTSRSIEMFFVLIMVNGMIYLVYTSEGYVLYGVIFLINTIVFQLLQNARKVDQWGDLDCPRSQSASFTGSKTGALINGRDVKEGTLCLPPAGETLIHAKDLTEAQRLQDCPSQISPNTWANGCGEHFKVRSKGYSKHKKKTESGKALYNCVAVDFFKVEARVNHIATDYQMPTPTVNFEHDNVPQFFVINVQFPSSAPSMMSSETDGPGYQVVHYFEIDKSTAEELKNPESMSEPTKLLLEYCKKAESDPKFRGRFKVIGLLRNPDELNLPTFISSYNGKPVLINKSGRLFRGKNYLEMDINVHNFSYLAKKGLYMMQNKFSSAYLNVGFVIEGRNDNEQPEKMLGCCQVNRPDISKATNLDIFA